MGVSHWVWNLQRQNENRYDDTKLTFSSPIVETLIGNMLPTKSLHSNIHPHLLNKVLSIVLHKVDGRDNGKFNKKTLEYFFSLLIKNFKP